MLQYILSDIVSKDCEIVVTAGGPCSNFNRACALQCAELGLKMHLICYTEHKDEFLKSDNFFICKLCGVEITHCEKKDVKKTIESVMSSYKSKGVKAINVYGGGRCLEGIYSYYEAVKELYVQLQGVLPNEIFVTCGTGTTTSGLLAGIQTFSPSTRLHAISIARMADVEIPIIEENLTMLGGYLGVDFNLNNLVYHDEYIMGEYGAVSEDLLNFISDFTSASGILVDPIYTGKALYGMSKILNESGHEHDALFWHTGALYTLLSNRCKFKSIC